MGTNIEYHVLYLSGGNGSSQDMLWRQSVPETQWNTRGRHLGPSTTRLETVLERDYLTPDCAESARPARVREEFNHFGGGRQGREHKGGAATGIREHTGADRLTGC